MITDCDLFLNWDEIPLELDGVRDHRLYTKLTEGLPEYPPVLLNDLFVDKVHPLSRCQKRGAIIATGWSSIPPTILE